MKFKVSKKEDPTVTFSLVEQTDGIIKLVATLNDSTSLIPTSFSLLDLNPNSKRLELCSGVPKILGLEVDAKGRLIPSIRD